MLKSCYECWGVPVCSIILVKFKFIEIPINYLFEDFWGLFHPYKFASLMSFSKSVISLSMIKIFHVTVVTTKWFIGHGFAIFRHMYHVYYTLIVLFYVLVLHFQPHSTMFTCCDHETRPHRGHWKTRVCRSPTSVVSPHSQQTLHALSDHYRTRYDSSGHSCSSLALLCKNHKITGMWPWQHFWLVCRTDTCDVMAVLLWWAKSKNLGSNTVACWMSFGPYNVK